MRAVFGLVLVVGLGLAGFAVYMVQGYFQQQNTALARECAVAAQQVPTVEVYAVNRVVQYGEQIMPEDVMLIRYAEPFLPEGTFATEEALFPQGTDVFRSALRQIVRATSACAPLITPASPGKAQPLNSRQPSFSNRATHLSRNSIFAVSICSGCVSLYRCSLPGGVAISPIKAMSHF